MGKEINPEWHQEVLEKYLRNGGVIEEVVSSLKSAQGLVECLAKRGIAFKIINLGAGVKRITNLMETCPKCNGTRKC